MVKIGKPYTYFFKLEPLKGTLSVQVSPPDARVFLGDRFVGIGEYTDRLAAGEYQLSAEAPDHQRREQTIEVIAEPDPARADRSRAGAASSGAGS